VVDARQEVIDELEGFEKDYNESFDDENFDNETAVANDLDVTSRKPEPDEGEPVPEATDTTEVASESTSDQSDKQPKPKMVTLPDDSDAFGEFAGKKVSYQELMEAGLVDKLVTWGHQGRHLTQRGQEDLEEARKMREVLEKQLKLQEDQISKANQAPPLPPKEHAEQLKREYLPLLEKAAEAGALEAGFLDNYPLVASQLESRFQATSQLANIIIAKMDELVQKSDKWSERDTTTASQSHLRTLANEVAESDELFKFVGDDDGYKDFMKWATAPNSTLNWVDRDVTTVTSQDILASALLYMRTHPEKFTKQKRKQATEEVRRQASGGGSGSNAETKQTGSDDELMSFAKDYVDSFQGQEY
jgi:ribosomal protein S19E (S16A)